MCACVLVQRVEETLPIVKEVDKSHVWFNSLSNCLPLAYPRTGFPSSSRI